MIFDLMDKTFQDNKRRSKLTSMRDIVTDALTSAQTLQGEYPPISKIQQMLDKRTQIRGTEAGARVR